MEINKVELGELDIFEIEIMEKVENSLDKVVSEANKIANRKDLKHSQAMKMECKIVFDCFNEIFGEGTDKKVFGNKTNLRVCLESFEELVEKFNNQKEEFDSIVSKYSPNRAARRSKK